MPKAIQKIHFDPKEELKTNSIVKITRSLRSIPSVLQEIGQWRIGFHLLKNQYGIVREKECDGLYYRLKIITGKASGKTHIFSIGELKRIGKDKIEQENLKHILKEEQRYGRLVPDIADYQGEVLEINPANVYQFHQELNPVLVEQLEAVEDDEDNDEDEDAEDEEENEV